MYIFSCFIFIIYFTINNPCKLVLKLIDHKIKNGIPNFNIYWSDANDFRMYSMIGKGSYGEVYIGKNIKTQQDVIIKTYSKEKNTLKKVLKEIWVTQNLCGGSNMIQLYDIYRNQTSDLPSLVLEYISTINTTSNLMLTWDFQEIRYYAYELLKGIEYAHSKHIIHKDIKPRNIVIDSKLKKLRIIDWGLSNYYSKDNNQNIAGSIHYKAPELLMNYSKSTLSSDMWSYGCVLASWFFQIETFFKGDDDINQLYYIAKVLGTKDLINYINKYELSFNKSIIKNELQKQKLATYVTYNNYRRTNKHGLDLLSKLLVYDHNYRINAKYALKHPYFTMLSN